MCSSDLTLCSEVIYNKKVAVNKVTHVLIFNVLTFVKVTVFKAFEKLYRSKIYNTVITVKQLFGYAVRKKCLSNSGFAKQQKVREFSVKCFYKEY